MPSIEEATEFSSSVLDGEYKDEECASSSSMEEQKVSIPALLTVICHKITNFKDDAPLPPGCMSRDENQEVSD